VASRAAIWSYNTAKLVLKALIVGPPTIDLVDLGMKLRRR
jgi:hypothetical protein